MEESSEKVIESPLALLERYKFTGKLTPQLRNEACDRVRRGSPPKWALRSLGLCTQTVQNWELWAKTGDKGPQYEELFRAMEIAESQYKDWLAQQGMRHVQRDGRTWMEAASRRMPEEFGRKDEVSISLQIEAGPILAQIAAAKQKLMEGEYKLLEDTSESSV
jgi:hypothetical protein